MALSGSVSTSSYDGRYLKLAWTATQDISTNKSTISWTLSAAGGDDSYYYDGPITVKIAGTTVYSKEGRTKRYKGTIKTGTITLTHGTDGSKSFSVSVKAAIYTYAVNCTGSKTFTLDKIPRAATISSADSFTDEGNPVLKYSNPAGSSATTLQACIASEDGMTIYAAYRDISKSGTSYTFNLTETEREALRKACVNAPSMTVKFYVKTVIGGETYKKNIAKTLTIANADPTGDISAYASDAITQNLWGTNSALILGVSDLTYSINYSLKKHATLKSIVVTNGNDKKTTATGTFTDVKDINTVAVITDSRGNTRTTNIVLASYVNYISPTATLSYSGVSVEGRVDLQMSGKYFNGSFGSTANTLIIEYRVREKGGSFGAFNTVSGTISNNTYTASTTVTGLDYHKVYEIEYRVTDKITSITSNLVTINFLPKFDWGENDFNFNVPIGVNISNAIAFKVDSDDTSSYIQSLPTYNRTYALSPNVYITNLGTFGRGTSSSRRYKEEIQDIVNEELNPLKILDIPVRQYKYNADNIPIDKEKDDIYIGLIAEEVEAAYPIAAEYNEDGTIEMWNIKVLFPALLKVVQEQQKEINLLKEQMEVQVDGL